MRSPAGMFVRGVAALSQRVRGSLGRSVGFNDARLFGSVRGVLRRSARVLLALSLLSSSTPAAPLVLKETTAEWGGGMAVWLQVGPMALLRDYLVAAQSAPPRRQEKQADRNSRVRQVQVYPGDVTVGLYEHVVFSAAALDGEGRPVGGVNFNWSAADYGRGGHATRITRWGEFEATAPGKYKVTADAGGKKGHVFVTVLDGPRRRPDERPIPVPAISSRDLAGAISMPAKPARRGGGKPKFVKTSAVATAPAAPIPPECEDEYHWNRCNYTGGDDPDNRRGNLPGGPLDQGAGNGNFQIGAPLISLPGRGRDVSLGLVYNSRVWTKLNGKINYDIDQDWPAPGWSLGFGRIVGLGLTGGGMLVDADGTRHSFSGPPPQVWSSGSIATLHTTDGTFIDYTTQANGAGTIVYANLRYPDGTNVIYGAPGAGAVYPTAIIDPNGNFINVTYVNNAGPRIQTVTDTLGRTLSFHYDANSLLTAVVGPGLDGGTRTLARLHYKELPTLNSSFVGLTPMVRDYTPWALDAVYFPATATGFWFGDDNSYSSYGMIQKVIEQRGMGFSASSLSEQGTVTQGTSSRQRDYGFQLANLTDAPTFTSLTESYEGMDTSAALTTFQMVEDSASRTLTTTLPNGTRSVQTTFKHPGQYDDGMLFHDETKDSGGNVLRSTDVVWEQGDYGSPRAVSMTVTDERGQKTGAEFGYGPSRNQLVESRAYDYGYAYLGTSNVLLRRAVTQYHDGAGYVSNHVFNLPTVVETYDGGGTRLARTEYQYDAATPPAAPNGAESLSNLPTPAAQHDDAYNPFAPLYPVEECALWDNDQINCLQWNTRWETAYRSGTDYRGNLTQITVYSNAAPETPTGAITQTRSYDITGNVLTATSSCCRQMSFEYTEATQYAYPSTQTRGSATDPLKQVKTSATYDFGTGLTLSTTDANGRISAVSYQPETLRAQTLTSPTGSRTEYLYDDVALTMTETVYLAPPPADTGALASRTVQYLNGKGMIKREKSLGAGGVWDIVDTKYDEVGRLWKQTRPYRDGETPEAATISYDALGRQKSVLGHDGSLTETFFNDLAPGHPRPDAASTSPGQTYLAVDAWGRERWGRNDALGRLVEVVEPHPDNSGGSVTSGGWVTTYSYDALGRLTGTNQGGQVRSFAYDSVGRLIRQKLAEADATLDDAGNYVGKGSPNAHWSDAFTYDDFSNLTRRVDARGVAANFDYNDPLNRLLSISYDLSGPHESLPNSPIVAAPSVSYTYRTKANAADLVDINQSEAVTTTGASGVVSTESNVYDVEGRLKVRTLTVSGRPQMRTDFFYDTLDRVTDVVYPAQNLAAGTGRKTVHQDYDVASRLAGLKVDGADFASQLLYDASSQTTQIKVGAAGDRQVTESYTYDPATGLLSRQRATRTVGGTTSALLDLSYDYLRPGTTTGRTGQVTRVVNNLDAQKGRSYTYDALGRLKLAAGGDPSASPSWTQSYTYDRWGNRTGVAAGGFTAEFKADGTPRHEQVAAQHAPPAGFPLEGGGARAVSDAPDMPRLFGAAKPPATSAAGMLLGAPSNLRVTQNSGTQGGAGQVTISWDAPAGAVSYYRVERKGAAGQYTFVANVPASSTSYADSGVTGGAAYLYRVRAVDTAGVSSAFSNIALGTAFTFADDPIIRAADDPSGATVTKVKAAHITQLREVVNAVRALVPGLGQASWTRPTLTPNASVIAADDVRDLRTALGAALAALGLNTPAYTDPAIYNGQGGVRTVVKGAHIAELRLAATRGASAGSGGGSTPVPADGLDGLTYDSASNRISTQGWEYDAAGSQTRARAASGGWQRYDYDAAGRLARVMSDDRQTVLASYTYDDGTERLVAQEGGSRTYYVSGGAGVIVEYAEALNSTQPLWSKSYVYLAGRLLSVITPDGGGGERVEYHHPDRLGTRLVSNSANDSVQEQTTLPFGTLMWAETSATTNRRFTSYDRSNATGLDYAVNRRYDSQQGRFTQVDQLEMDATSLFSPQTLNLYTYCGNDPVNNQDADGLFFGKLFKWIGKAFKWIGLILAVAAIVVTAIIMFAPAGSFLSKAAIWMFVHVLLPLSQMPIIGAMFPIGMTFGTPSWNPDSRGFGNSWQQDGYENVPSCTQSNVLPCVADGVVRTKSSAPAWPGWLDRTIDNVVTFSAGLANALTFNGARWAGTRLAGAIGGPRAAEMAAQDYDRMEQSNVYTAGELASIFVPLPGTKLKVLNKGMKFFKEFDRGGAAFGHSMRRIGRFTEFAVNVPGTNGKSFTRWVKVVNQNGKTIKMYHDTFLNTGKFIHRGFKVPFRPGHVP